MAKVKIIRDVIVAGVRKDSGAVIDVTDADASILVNAGKAELSVVSAPPKKPKAAPAPEKKLLSTESMKETVKTKTSTPPKEAG